MRLKNQEIVGYLTSRVLQLTLMPTERCNFRCAYCWEEFVQGRMDNWVVTAVKALLDRRADDLEWLSLDWFGGEPMLVMDIVEDIQEFALALARNRPMLTLRSSMTTNGYLLDEERLVRLTELGVKRFMIALDGPPETHDRQRVTASGKGTFARIWTNLLSARQSESDFKIVVRLQIGRESPGSVVKFLRLFSSELARDDRFELAIIPLSYLRPSLDPPSNPHRASGLAEAANQVAQSMGLIAPAAVDGPVVCHAARANAFVVRSDGTLAKCPVALYNQENSVGKLLEDGRVEIDTGRMSGWLRGLESWDEAELRCPMVGYADTSPAG